MPKTAIHLGANLPFLLERQDRIWKILTGTVDVFYAEIDAEGVFQSSRHYLYSAGPGDLLYGLRPSPGAGSITLMAVSADADLAELSAAELWRTSRTELAAMIERWIVQLAASLYAGSFPREYQALEPDDHYRLRQGEIAYPTRHLLWVRSQHGKIGVYGDPDSGKTIGPDDPPVPVTQTLWIKAASGGAELSTCPTLAVLDDREEMQAAIDALQHYFYGKIARQYEAEVAETNRLIAQKIATDSQTIERSLGQLGGVVAMHRDEAAFAQVDRSNPLLATCQLIGQEVGFEFVAPKHLDEHSRDTTNMLFAIGQVSQVRIRKVILRGDWWKDENGHLLAFTQDTKKPVALIQTSPTTYVMKDVETLTAQVVTAEIAQTLNPVAYMFFYSFREAMTSIRKIWDFAIQGVQRDAWFLILAALCGSLIGLLVPVLSGVLFDDVIPQADRGFLAEVFVIMLVIGMVTALLQLVKGLLLIRVETQSNIQTQAALMDHLLRLPVTFFRKFASGDLAMRALGINGIRQILSNTVLTAVLTGVFSIVNLLLLFYYDASLAWVGIALALLAVAVITGIGLLKLRYDRQVADVEGDIQGYLFEFLSGVTKIRITGSEKRIFAMWAQRFARLKELAFRSGNHQNGVEVFNASYPLITRIFFFGFLYYWMQTSDPAERSLISVGAFMAFVSAFGQFLNDCLTLSIALISSLNMIPLYERVKPILEAVPESTGESTDPGELVGEIELNAINFRYAPDQPLVLEDVSMRIKPGEMVAFVGPSGSGKSTIMRILLGFEQPESGSVYYDGQPFDSLNKDLVRRQIGVVLQNGSLMAGSIYKNIVGNAELSLDQAWEAARMAGLEEDIKQMPMEMHTVISEGAGTFSGGQRQRLMIARAIVHKPRILFMDEATSALDNRTQNIVTESLDRLQATRIVIAHRLSTIINADRIFVLEAGRVVESGTYQELLEKGGVFSKLASRQLA